MCVFLTFHHIHYYLRNVRSTFAQTLNNMYKARGQFSHGRINAIDLEAGDYVAIQADGPTWTVQSIIDDREQSNSIVVTLTRTAYNTPVTVCLVYAPTEQLHAR
jgi:hypothetical protein